MEWLEWFNKIKAFAGEYGVQFTVLLVVAVVVLCVWWNWDDISVRPGISSLINWTRSWVVSKADSKVFTVAIARLDDDPDELGLKMIVESLRGLNGVNVQCMKHLIRLKPGDKGPVGHQQALKLLRKNGASVLVWGKVQKGLDGKGNPLLKLYFTSAESGGEPGRYVPNEVHELPELFWNDLTTVLGLVVQTSYAEYSGRDGHYVADQLIPFIQKVRTLVAKGERWTTEAKAGVQRILAGALQTAGQQAGSNEWLLESITLYRQSLNVVTREKVPMDWAVTQNNLGSALRALGERESGTARLEEAVEAYREALTVLSPENVPSYWTVAQANLENALRLLGNRKTESTKYPN